MNKRTIIIIIAIGTLVLGALVYVFFTINPARKAGLQNTVQNIFPFGQSQTPTPAEPVPTQNGTVIEIPGGGTIITTAPALRQVSDLPINGYRAITTEELQNLPRTTTGANGEATTTMELRPVKNYAVRFGNLATGAVYESKIKDTIETSQLTDSNIPFIDHLSFNLSGTSLFFQYANGALGSESIRTYFSHINPIQVSVDPCPFVFPVNLKFQDKSDAVANVQRFLNGYLGVIISQTGENSPGNETGIYDELTRDAVKRFQTSNSLTADGNVGPKTRTALQAACMVVQTQKANERFQATNKFLFRTQGAYGPDNIIDIENVDSDTVFYLIKNNGKAYGFLYSIATGTAQQVFDSPFTEWLSQPLSREKILFTTKASGNVPGFMYEFNTQNKTFKKIIGNFNGLTTLASPDGQNVLLGATTQDGYETLLFKRSLNKALPLGIKTLPEKCVWNATGTIIYCAIPDQLPSGLYPDAWYQGTVTTKDTLWSINIVNGTRQKLADPKDVSSNEMMISDLQVTSDDRFLFFKNLNDNTLWVLDLFQ